jgi:hypothetical protein
MHPDRKNDRRDRRVATGFENHSHFFQRLRQRVWGTSGRNFKKNL